MVPLEKLSEKNYKRVQSPLKDGLMKKTPVEAGINLPHGAKNNFPDTKYFRPNNDLKFGGCSYEEGKFEFSKEEWLSILNKNDKGNVRLSTNKYPKMFRQHIKTVNNTCVINVKTVKYPKKSFNYVYMYCRHKGCKSFKLVIQPQTNGNVLVVVLSSSLDYYHNNKTVKSDLPGKYAQNVKSVKVLKKIDSEPSSADIFDKDDMVDLMMMYSENKDYVRCVGLPSYVHCYSIEQLTLLTKLKSKGQELLTGYLDSTRSVVRKASIYYSVVVNTSLSEKSSITCPVVEMISSSHDMVAISEWLNGFKAFVFQEEQCWPLFANIVTDFNFAQIDAICIGWNGFSSIFDYLDWCYKVLFDEQDGSNMTIINICVNHFTKAIVNHVYKYFKNDGTLAKGVKRKTINNDIIDWICLLFNMGSMDEISQWFKVFTLVLLSKTKNSEMMSALQTLQNNCMSNCQLLYDQDQDDNDDSLDDVHRIYCETQMGKSLLYCKFKKIKDDIKNNLVVCSDEGTELNEYYNEEYFEHFILECVPFIPLWTPVMNKKVNNRVMVQQSNDTVESWFKTIISDMLDSDGRLKCGQFVKTLRDRVLTVCKQASLWI